MNSPFVIEQARDFAARSEIASADTQEEKVQAMYRLLFQRTPTSEELGVAIQFLEEPTQGPVEASKSELPRLEQLAQLLLLTNEFIYFD